ncbi:MAG: iron-containing alcohol dehydrogenase family protein [Chloroflexota bacterium]|nr:iron-containing alcohol dehydrogenase family protein [Chloroflexota bacterium]
MPDISMLEYNYKNIGQDIICGPHTIDSINETLDDLRVTKALIVCGPTILSQSDVVHRTQASLGDRYLGTFSGVAPHSPVSTVEEGVAICKDLQPEVIVAVGGGSTSDTAKGISMVWSGGGDIHDYAIQFEPPNKIIYPETPTETIPIVAVPTTLGGAELSSGGGGFTDKALGRKISLSGRTTRPKVVIVDGQALATTPMRIMLGTAIGQLRIAIESVYSTSHNPIGDALALHSIRMIMDYLPKCVERDLNVLLHAKTAACLPMLAMSAVGGGLGINTAIAHHVGGLYGVNHGEANAILLPHTMRYNLDACADRQVLIAEAMGIDVKGMSEEESGLAAAESVASLCRSLDLPERLRDVDVPKDGLEYIAAATLHDRALATNPKPISDATPIMDVMNMAW